MTSPLDPGAPPASEARSSPESSTASAGNQEEAREGNAGVGNPFENPDVRIITTPDARKFILVGTAHVSRESTELVRRVVEAAQPDGVCIELDPGRYAALSQPQRFEQLDLRQVLAARQLPTLFANLLLASFQHSLGMKLGVRPGSELLEGARAAEAIGKPFHLCDREVRQTLKRAWAALSLWKKSLLAGALVESLFARPEMSEDDLRELRERDAMTQLMEELSKAFPGLKRVLIDERDAYLAEKIRRAPGSKLVAVVGAGHVAGLAAHLERGGEVDLAPLEALPPPSRFAGWFGWAFALAIVGSVVALGLLRGPGAVGESALAWVFATGVPCAIGTALAFGHPVTIASGFFAAPLTTLHPALGAGYVTAAVQAYLRPPFVREFSSVLGDLESVRGLWQNRLLRVLMVFVLSSVFTAAGAWFGFAQLMHTLFAKP